VRQSHRQRRQRFQQVSDRSQGRVRRDQRQDRNAWWQAGQMHQAEAGDLQYSVAWYHQGCGSKAALSGKVDNLVGLKENVILGHLIPAGTGFKIFQDSEVQYNLEAMREAAAAPSTTLEDSFPLLDSGSPSAGAATGGGGEFANAMSEQGVVPTGSATQETGLAALLGGSTATEQPPADANTGMIGEDDLTKIEGVGPAIAGHLKAAGINSYSELAATWTVDGKLAGLLQRLLRLKLHRRLTFPSLGSCQSHRLLTFRNLDSFQNLLLLTFPNPGSFQNHRRRTLRNLDSFQSLRLLTLPLHPDSQHLKRFLRLHLTRHRRLRLQPTT